MDKDKLTAMRPQQECIYKEKQKKEESSGTAVRGKSITITNKNTTSSLLQAPLIRLGITPLKKTRLQETAKCFQVVDTNISFRDSNF